MSEKPIEIHITEQELETLRIVVSRLMFAAHNLTSRERLYPSQAKRYYKILKGLLERLEASTDKEVPMKV